MAPIRKAVSGREAAKLVRQTLDDARRERERGTLDTAIEANQRHVAVTGEPMPQGGKHRKGRGR
jgi:hypothetical protein